MNRETAIRKACKGKKTEVKTEKSRWNTFFIPTGFNSCREYSISIAGEINEGFLWTINKNNQIEEKHD